MVIISSKSTDVWSNGYNGILNINNNTNNNYSKWTISCVLPIGSTITWSNSLQLGKIDKNNQMILYPQSYSPTITANTTQLIQFGGSGTMPINFIFNSDDSSKPIPRPKPEPTPKPEPIPIPTPKPKPEPIVQINLFTPKRDCCCSQLGGNHPPYLDVHCNSLFFFTRIFF